MNHNDVLRSLRYMLKVNDAKMAEIIGLSGLEVHPLVLATYLKKRRRGRLRALPGTGDGALP